MEPDKLSTPERMRALALLQGLDRVPVNASASVYAAAISGISAREYYLEPEKAMEAGLWALDMHGYDASPSYNIPDWSGWDFGGEMNFPTHPQISLPYLTKRAVESPQDVELLQVPDLSGPAIGRMIEFAKLSREKGFGVTMPAGSSIGIAGSIIGPERMFRWFRNEPASVHRVLRVATDYLLKIADYFIAEFGPENCTAFTAYPLECHGVISPKMFEKYSLPYVIELHQKLIEKGIKKWIVHLCGDHTKNLPFWTRDISLSPRTIFHIGHEMDIEATGLVFGEEHIIGGNVPTTLLQTGTANEVYETCREIIEKMKFNPGGFILMPACALPALTPPVNVYAMIKAARTFGKY